MIAEGALVTGNHRALARKAGSTPKAKSPVSSTLQSRKPAISFVNVVLRLDDARCNEEDQLLVGGADRLPFEQVAQVRDAAQQRYLLDVD